MKVKVIFFFVLAVVLVAVPLVINAQEKKAKEASMTGCFNKGDMAGYFVLADKKTGKKTTVTGPPDLERHSANHEVRVTGSMAKENDKEVFKATKIQHVGTNCQAPAPK